MEVRRRKQIYRVCCSIHKLQLHIELVKLGCCFYKRNFNISSFFRISLIVTQEVLMKRLGPQAHLINLKLNHAVPASVRLLPAKEYRGAAIGINYDLRVYTGKSSGSLSALAK